MLDSEVHLWLLDPARIRAAEEELAARGGLDAGELSKLAQLRHPGRHREFLAGRALVRTSLSEEAPGIPPSAWRFELNSHGCPRIAAPPSALRFNLSHTEGLIACAVTSGREVGVDVESVTRRADTVEIADRFFSPREVQALRSLSPPAQRDRFFDLWTLKESYIKARGLGLSLPLEKFSFTLQPGAAPALDVDPELGDDGASWRFFLFSPTAGHRAALAVRAPAVPALVTRWRDIG